MNIFIYLLIYLLCSTAGLILLKGSIVGLELNSLASYFSLLKNYKFIFGFILYSASFIVWLILLSKKDLVNIYPVVVGLGYLLIMITAIIFLKEHLTFYGAVGATLVGLGIVLIALQS